MGIGGQNQTPQGGAPTGTEGTAPN